MNSVFSLQTPSSSQRNIASKFFISAPSLQEVQDYPNHQEDLEDPVKQEEFRRKRLNYSFQDGYYQQK